MGKSHSKNSPWKKTSVANLIRYQPSKTYFARAKIDGKLIRQSLKTKVFSVAKLRLADLIKTHRQSSEKSKSAKHGKMTFGGALEIYRNKLRDNPTLKPRSKEYREETIQALLKSWRNLPSIEIRNISEEDCLLWASNFHKNHCATVYNNTVGTLRHVFAISISYGVRYTNPASAIPKVRPSKKQLHLPEPTEFKKIVKSVETAGSRFSIYCSELIRFLAFSGLRKTEASFVTWGDLNFKNREIAVVGDPVYKTKNSEIRIIPMIPEMVKLLLEIKSRRTPKEVNTPIMRVRECQKAIDNACTKLKLHRFTHHDLRHLFATRCIESGVDIPTVSRWLGHKDGGALAMKTYGHLRNEHSKAMAKKVKF